MERVIVYIDGLNLYFGIKSKGWQRYLWLNMEALAEELLIDGQRLVSTRYFTTRVKGSIAKSNRQNNYISALKVSTDVQFFYGRYQPNVKKCKKCNSTWMEFEEKMTDVHIACEILRDAYQNKFDTAILISADADLIPPIEILQEDLPSRRIVVAFPPDRRSRRLKKTVQSCIYIGRRKLRDSQLPDLITKPNGYVIRRPPEWG